MASFSVKTLMAEIETLLSEKNDGYTEYQEKKRWGNELLTIKRSIGWVFHAAPLSLFPSALFYVKGHKKKERQYILCQATLHGQESDFD